MLIMYRTKKNTVSIVSPTDEALKISGIEDIAKKIVPKDLEYKIIKETDIPTDKKFRNYWKWDSSIEPDGFGGENNAFDNKLLEKYRGEK